MSIAITPDIQAKVLTDFGQAISIGPEWVGAVARILESNRPHDDPTPIDADRVEEWVAGIGTVPDWAWDAVARIAGQRAGMLKQCAEELSRIKRGLDQRQQ